MKTREIIITVIFALITIAVLVIVKFDIKMTMFILMSWLLLIVSIINIQYAVIVLLFSRSSMDALIENPLSIAGLSITISSLLACYSIIIIIAYLLTNKIYVKNSIARSYYAFIIISIITALIPGNYHFGLIYILKFISILCIYLIVYFLCAWLENFERTILKTIIASAIIPLVLGLYQIIFNKEASLIAGDLNRIHGTFVHPNVFAFFLLIIIAVSVIYLLNYNQKNLFLYFIIALSLVELYSTYTRGAWLGLAFMVIIYTTFSKIKFSNKLLIFTLIIFLIIPLYTPIADRFANVLSTNPEESSLATRVYIWKEMFILAFHKPLLGYGIGSFKTLSSHVLNWGIEAHNDYLKLLVETGALGLISYLVIQWNTLATIIKKKHPNYRVLFIFLTVFFLLSLADNIIDMTVCQWYIWALAAIYSRGQTPGALTPTNYKLSPIHYPLSTIT